MDVSSRSPASSARFGRLVERADERDFPFYDGRPVGLRGWQWGVVVLAAVVGMLVLILVPVPDQGVLLLTRALFVAIPLGVFAVFARGWVRSLFRPVGARDVLDMVVFWLLNFAVSALVALLLARADPAHLVKNAATDGLVEAGAGEIALFYLGTFIQLFGEEVFTILPFLAVLYWSTRLGASRKLAMVVAWVATALLFGAVHLPTYGWNVAQALIGIGIARLVLSLAFIRTKNILVSFGAHLLNDWVGFTFALVAATALAG